MDARKMIPAFSKQWREWLVEFSKKDNPNPVLRQLLAEWASILKELGE